MQTVNSINSNCFAVISPQIDLDQNMFDTEKWSAVKMINVLSAEGEFIANSTLSHPNVQNLLMKHEKQFDAVVVEVFWVEALYGEFR